MSVSHVEERVRWLNHPAVRVGLPIDEEITVESTHRWLDRVRQDRSRRDLVVVNEHGKPLAMMGITGVDPAARHGELYLFVKPDCHGRGTGSFALEQLCRIGFEDLALNRILLFTLGSNGGAQRFYLRHGFRAEGVLRQHAVVRGRLEDRHVFGLLRTEWLELDEALSLSPTAG